MGQEYPRCPMVKPKWTMVSIKCSSEGMRVVTCVRLCKVKIEVREWGRGRIGDSMLQTSELPMSRLALHSHIHGS